MSDREMLTSNEQLRATAQQMLNDGYSHMLVDPLDILRLTAEPPPTLIPAPDLSEHIAWLREHIERLNALRDHLACRASEPPPAARCHADPIYCTPECRQKTCDHAWDFNHVPPQCAFGCGATREMPDARAVTKEESR